MPDAEKSHDEELEKDFDAIICAVEQLPLVEVRTLTVGLLLRVFVQMLEDQSPQSAAAAQFIRNYRKRAALLPT
jgi:hypothetical protein